MNWLGGECRHDAAKVSLELLADLLLVCASHCGQHYWSSEVSRKLATELSALLVEQCGCSSVAELLGGERGLMEAAVAKLKARLSRSSWKEHPSAKQAMIWCLRRLRHPSVAPHLDFFLPACLLLLDDHESHNKVLGLSAARHITANVDASELRWYGRAEVLYQAMRSMLYSGETEVVGALHPTLLVLLPVVDGPTAEQKHAAEVFTILLSSLDIEPKTTMRKAYIAHVRGYIELLGVNTARHMKVLVAVLCSCLEFPDYCGEHTRRDALAAMAALMQHLWPRIPCHQQTLLRALLKLVSDVYSQSGGGEVSAANQKLVAPLTECFVLLGQCCEDIKQCYEELRETPTHKGLTICLADVLRQLQNHDV